jgi:hypothetical protein
MNTQLKIRISFSDTRYIGWRLRYPGEGGNQNPIGMPAVAPAENAPPVPFDERLQVLSWKLMQRMNPTITPKQWRSVYAYNRAFTNGNGFDEPGDPRADFVNRLDLQAPLPKLMKAIICSGSLYQGIVEGDKLVMYPGVHAMDAENPVSLDDIIRNGWYFLAVSWTGKGGTHFPQGNGGIVPVPYIIEERVEYPLKWFERWEYPYPPNPLAMYA